MAESSATSRALSILEAVKLTSDGDIPALNQLLLTRILQPELILRILLTFLPKGTDPESYIGLLKNLPKELSRPTSDYSKHPKLDIDDAEACRRARKLHLAPLYSPQHLFEQETDILTLFLVQQAYRIEADTGSLTDIVQLLEPFLHHSDVLRTWMISTLLPTLRFNYEFYPQSRTPIELNFLERIGENGAIQTLLSKAAGGYGVEDKVDIGRDIRGLVGPWMYGESSRKRRKIGRNRDQEESISFDNSSRSLTLQEDDVDTAWSYMNEWILDLGARDFTKAVDALVQWNGPVDVDYGAWGEQIESQGHDRLTKDYAQAGLAVIYATERASMETIIGSHRLLNKVANLVTLDSPPDLKRSDEPASADIPASTFKSINQTQLLRNTLLQAHNTLTVANAHSLLLCNLILSSVYKLLNLGNVKSIREATRLCLFGTEPEQMKELQRTLYKLKSEKLDEALWTSIRKQLLWLRDWEKSSGFETAEPRGVFCRISIADLETEILRAMLDGGCYDLAAKIYCSAAQRPLTSKIVEDTALNAALASYDAASNGNRTRGGVRKASDIIATFGGFFPHSEGYSQTAALLNATHSMSFYSLSLQHGMPFQPVNIRAHQDSMSLIGKILRQNPQSYTHLDDLLAIGQNLVAAGLIHINKLNRSEWNTPEDATANARHRITRMAIEAALSEDDFDTAYSYVVNRLATVGESSEKASIALHDDVSWRAAYAAGRHPMNDTDGSTIRRLEQRMELLSQALLLAPPPALSEILHTWQQFEFKLTELLKNEAAEDESWEKRTSQVPGGFTEYGRQAHLGPQDRSRKGLQEEAPMGLFEVARGAASALSKNAFPLRVPQTDGSPRMAQERRASVGSSGSDGRGVEGIGRVRKRDMVSNMVTGGLASGIGWVIGAPPTRHDQG